MTRVTDGSRRITVDYEGYDYDRESGSITDSNGELIAIVPGRIAENAARVLTYDIDSLIDDGYTDIDESFRENYDNVTDLLKRIEKLNGIKNAKGTASDAIDLISYEIERVSKRVTEQVSIALEKHHEDDINHDVNAVNDIMNGSSLADEWSNR